MGSAPETTTIAIDDRIERNLRKKEATQKAQRCDALGGRLREGGRGNGGAKAFNYIAEMPGSATGVKGMR